MPPLTYQYSKAWLECMLVTGCYTLMTELSHVVPARKKTLLLTALASLYRQAQPRKTLYPRSSLLLPSLVQRTSYWMPGGKVINRLPPLMLTIPVMSHFCTESASPARFWRSVHLELEWFCISLPQLHEGEFLSHNATVMSMNCLLYACRGCTLHGVCCTCIPRPTLVCTPCW